MATRTDIAQSSTPELFAGVIADAKEIAVGHIGKMRHEIGDELTELKHYLARVVLAAGVMVIGSVLAGHALAHGLIAFGLPVWAGFLLATLISFGVGYLLIKKLPGNKKNMDLVPESSLHDLKRDIEQVGDQLTH